MAKVHGPKNIRNKGHRHAKRGKLSFGPRRKGSAHLHGKKKVGKRHTVGRYRKHKKIEGRKQLMAAFARYWRKHKAAIMEKYPTHKPGVLKNRARRHFMREYGLPKEYLKRRGILRRKGHMTKYAAFVKAMYPKLKAKHPNASRTQMFKLIAHAWKHGTKSMTKKRTTRKTHHTKKHHHVGERRMTRAMTRAR